MKDKTSIILEIVFFVLFTIAVYPQLFNLCLGLTAYSNILLLGSIAVLLLGTIALVKYPMKNIYIKIALIYVGVIILACLVPIALFFARPF